MLTLEFLGRSFAVVEWMHFLTCDACPTEDLLDNLHYASLTEAEIHGLRNFMRPFPNLIMRVKIKSGLDSRTHCDYVVKLDGEVRLVVFHAKGFVHYRVELRREDNVTEALGRVKKLNLLRE